MKKIFGLLIGLLSCISFGYCEDVENLVDYIGGTNTISIPGNSYHTVIELNNSSDYGTYCLDVSSLDSAFNIGFGNSLNYDSNLGYSIFDNWGSFYACIYSNARYIFIYNPFSSSHSITYRLFKLNVLLNTDIPVMTSLECQQNYSLIPISEITTNYCQLNGLCPSVPSEDSSGGVSNFYVFSNGRYNQLSGTLNYFVNIPDYLDYSYDYSNNGDDLDLDIGIVYDTGYIDGIVNTQNYKPTTEDFTKLVGLLAPYTKILVFLLFVFLIWAWIKKPFKSKKL